MIIEDSPHTCLPTVFPMSPIVLQEVYLPLLQQMLQRKQPLLEVIGIQTPLAVEVTVVDFLAAALAAGAAEAGKRKPLADYKSSTTSELRYI